jgi:hypothetical protein
MEPNVLIGGEYPGKLGTNDTDDIAKHWKENKTSSIGKNETGPMRRPDRELEAGLRDGRDGSNICPLQGLLPRG